MWVRCCLIPMPPPALGRRVPTRSVVPGPQQARDTGTGGRQSVAQASRRFPDNLVPCLRPTQRGRKPCLGSLGPEFWPCHSLLRDLGLLCDQGLPLLGISFLI